MMVGICKQPLAADRWWVLIFDVRKNETTIDDDDAMFPTREATSAM